MNDDEILKEWAKEEKRIYAEIVEEDRVTQLAFKEANGRSMNQKDSEYWRTAEHFRSRYESEIKIPRNKARELSKKLAAEVDPALVDEASSKRKTKKFRTQVVKAATGKKDCVECGGVIEPTGKRGRPPVRCIGCRAKIEPKKVVLVPVEDDDEFLRVG